MKKKLGLFIVLGLVGIVVVTTIILGVIKKDYRPDMQTTFQSVIITNSNDSSFNRSFGRLDEGNDFENIVAAYNNSFKQSILASFFSGNISNKITAEHAYSISSISGYKMVWRLNKEGEEIVATDSEEVKRVDELTVGVEDSNGFKEITIYARILTPENQIKSYLKITTKANFEALYDLLEELRA